VRDWRGGNNGVGLAVEGRRDGEGRGAAKHEEEHGTGPGESGSTVAARAEKGWEVTMRGDGRGGEGEATVGGAGRDAWRGRELDAVQVGPLSF
jgi:hypothetical protein